MTTRRPLLVAVPTGAEAERLVHDLAQFLGAGRRRALPGVGDAPVRAGVAVVRDHGPSPAGDVAAPRPGARRPRSWSRRCARSCSASARTSRRSSRWSSVPATSVDRDELVARLVAGGYRREYQVEARGEVAVRGSIVDVYPSTDDHPVRIDLWGDEVDRLSAFAVADQRSTHDVDEVCVFPTRELLPTDEVRERGRRARRPAAVGREQWERLADGQVFDGMESWLPWLTDREHLLTDLLPDDRARAARRAEAHARPRPGAARRGGVAGGDARRHLGRGWRARPAAPLARVRPVARAHRRGRGVAAVDARQRPTRRASPPPRSTRSSATPTRWRADSARSRATATASCSPPKAPVLRSDCTTSSRAKGSTPAPASPRPARCGCVVAPLERGVVLPGAHLALVAEADLTGRRRVHRRARGARRGRRLLRRRSSPATTSCTTSTASAATSR